MIIRLRSLFLVVSCFCLALPGRALADAPPRSAASASASETSAALAPEAATAPAPRQQTRHKQPVYFGPTYLNLVRAMIRFKGFDIDNDDLLDAYTVIEGCDLYSKFYKDDFAWKQVRVIYRQSLRQNMDLMPEYFSFVTPIQLDRYDFQSGIFRFSKNSMMRNVHRLILSEHQFYPVCKENRADLSRLPIVIGMILQPFTIEGLVMPPDQAESLIADLQHKPESGRVVYARFHVRIDAAPPISKDPGKTGSYDFQGILETITFFEDLDLQRPLWVYRQIYKSEEQKAQELNDILNLKRPTAPEPAPPASAPATVSLPPD